ncbi:MAG: hypothetical protein WC932_05515 [archaeon]|jgi:hypothetical protein
MMDFKKAISFAYENVKWYYLVFILALASLSMISDVMTLISLTLVLIFGIGIIGTKLAGKLKTVKQSIVPVLKNTGMYTIVSIIFVVAQYILLIIGMIPFIIIASQLDLGSLTDAGNFEALLYSTPGWLILVSILVFIIFLVAVLLLEIIKTFGMVRYFKTGKFQDIFKVGKYFKAIFTKDYFILLTFVIGNTLIGIIILAIITFILTTISETVGILISGMLIILFTYIVTGTSYSLVNDYLMDKK